MIEAQEAFSAEVAEVIADASVRFQMIFEIIVGVEALAAFILLGVGEGRKRRGERDW